MPAPTMMILWFLSLVIIKDLGGGINGESWLLLGGQAL